MAHRDRTIWKFKLEITDQQVVQLYRTYELLTVQIQDQKPTLWAMVNPLTGMRDIVIYCYGTGNPGPPSDQKYLATVQLDGFVWHFYCERRGA